MALKIKDSLNKYNEATIPCESVVMWYTGEGNQPQDSGVAITLCRVSSGFDSGFDVYLSKYSAENGSWEIIIGMSGNPAPTDGVAEVIAWTDVPFPKLGTALYN